MFYRYDKRIREWCFESFDGASTMGNCLGVLPIKLFGSMIIISAFLSMELPKKLSKRMVAESWELLRDRIFEALYGNCQGC